MPVATEKPVHTPQMARKSIAHTMEMESHAVLMRLLSWRITNMLRPLR